MGFDYTKLGFKAGLEIHQQLEGNKLFCNCPGYLRSEKPDLLVTRKLHAVAGESGEVDAAVKHEAGLDKTFVYEYYNDSNCLIELDEEPPKKINEHALNEALKIALLLNCEIYFDTQVMRKTVIDGSNTSGFQRTTLIAKNGYVETRFGKVPVATVCLEEDSARTVGDKEEQEENVRVWRLDRLGIPLIEIATEPAIINPEQIKEAALKIGEVLRACKVKRGIGTIRQDINISIKGHERVEIKGFQDPGMMVITSDKEIERQLNDIKEKKTDGEVRGALPNGETKFNRPMPGKARMYPETDLPLLHIPLQRINELKKNLPRLRQDIKEELKKKGLNDELINLVLDGNLDDFNLLMKVHDNANLVAKMVTLWRNEFATKYKKSFEEVREILNEVLLEKILEGVEKEEIGEGDVKGILIKIMNGEDVEKAMKIEKVDHNALEEQIHQIVKENPGLRAGAYMGIIIGKLGVNVDKRKAMEILSRIVK
ncbi:MAG: Glu-tRNA(Gln) amidotransferase subunit GatE [Nanoarchaeota archaeon]